jgi:hypothetical protein
MDRFKLRQHSREETVVDLLAERPLWPNTTLLFQRDLRRARGVGCLWMLKVPATILERAVEKEPLCS